MADSGEGHVPPGLRIASMTRWALIAVAAAAATGAWIVYARSGSEIASSAEQYRCPMHPSVLQDHPGDCGICGMALVPVARSAAESSSAAVPGLVPVQIDPGRTQLIGMRTAKATRERTTSQLRTVGFVSADDSRIAIATTRFAGWVDEVLVAQGERVRKGQILATASGPELTTAQQVFLASREWSTKQKAAAGMASRESDEENNPLRRLGVDQRDIARIVKRNRPLPAIPIRAPISGYVARRNVLKGLYVQPGVELFQIVDLSKVWVLADVPELDATRLRVGQRAQLVLAASGGEAFGGVLDFVYPAVDAATHTLQARMQLENADLKLRPGMYGDLIVEVPAADALTVPAEAVVDTGELQYVFVARGGGRFEPRVVRLGEKAGGSIQVLDGVAEGEPVVTTANFLVDSESRMRAAAEAFSASRQPPPRTAERR